MQKTLPSFLRLFVAAMCCSFWLAAAHGQTPWILRNERVGGETLWGVATGAAGVVAVGTHGLILQSADGQTWKPRDSGTTDWLPL
jgi:hypothetical protein